MSEKILRAKEIVFDYIDNNIDQDLRILGADHPYNDTTVCRIKEAFDILCIAGVFD